jgi:hypothetical protein
MMMMMIAGHRKWPRRAPIDGACPAGGNEQQIVPACVGRARPRETAQDRRHRRHAAGRPWPWATPAIMSPNRQSRSCPAGLARLHVSRRRPPEAEIGRTAPFMRPPCLLRWPHTHNMRPPIALGEFWRMREWTCACDMLPRRRATATRADNHPLIPPPRDHRSRGSASLAPCAIHTHRARLPPPPPPPFRTWPPMTTSYIVFALIIINSE